MSKTGVTAMSKTETTNEQPIALPVRYTEDNGRGAYLVDANGNDLDDATADDGVRNRVGHYIATCINSHAALTQQVADLKAEVARLSGLFRKIDTADFDGNFCVEQFNGQFRAKRYDEDGTKLETTDYFQTVPEAVEALQAISRIKEGRG
jgi:hypothetical protein